LSRSVDFSRRIAAGLGHLPSDDALAQLVGNRGVPTAPRALRQANANDSAFGSEAPGHGHELLGRARPELASSPLGYRGDFPPLDSPLSKVRRSAD
jgi:hypothetical protein